ncbi:hypothetical protein [Streptomyces sp. NPDC126503]|uniref:hypothetical protein n=1 Tax=Streptomyces sp. NPDC126503 TaxID=3155315 RepID=UPI003332D115
MTQPEPGQIYRSCKPGYEDFRIRITSVGAERVSAVSVDGGWTLLNPPLIRQLHASPTTKTGTSRRTGYVLETP